MNAEIRKELEEVLNKCNGKKYPYICKKLQFQDGKELVMNMIYSRLEQFPDWTLQNCLSDTELYLSGFID